MKGLPRPKFKARKTVTVEADTGDEKMPESEEVTMIWCVFTDQSWKVLKYYYSCWPPILQEQQQRTVLIIVVVLHCCCVHLCSINEEPDCTTPVSCSRQPGGICPLGVARISWLTYPLSKGINSSSLDVETSTFLKKMPAKDVGTLDYALLAIDRGPRQVHYLFASRFMQGPRRRTEKFHPFFHPTAKRSHYLKWNLVTRKSSSLNGFFIWLSSIVMLDGLSTYQYDQCCWIERACACVSLSTRKTKLVFF